MFGLVMYFGGYDVLIWLFLGSFHIFFLFISEQGFTEPSSDKLLPDLHPQEQHVFTLVLDLNETLVYSDWKVCFVSKQCLFLTRKIAIELYSCLYSQMYPCIHNIDRQWLVLFNI